MMKRYKGQRIFFVDDELKICEAVTGTLEVLDLEVVCFTNAAACLKQLALQKCDLLITDVRMPGMDGLELLSKTKRIYPRLPVLVVTGYDDIPVAMKALAAEFIEKPLDRKNFLKIVKSALSKKW